MEYYIVGNFIQMVVQTGPSFWENRSRASGQEIAASYPTNEMVKMFRSEKDALRYANSISTDERKAFLSDKLKPVFKVKYNGDEKELVWEKETINFVYTQYHEERANFKTCPTSAAHVSKEVDVCLVELASLTRIRGNLKNYGFYESKGDHTERGNVNFEWQCALF